MRISDWSSDVVLFRSDPARQEDGVSGRKGGAMLIFVIMAAVAGVQDVPTTEPAATPVMGSVPASAKWLSEPVLPNVAVSELECCAGPDSDSSLSGMG